MSKDERLKLIGLIAVAVVVTVKNPGLAAGILLFGIVVALHEAGHMIFAKRAGMKVDTFSIGLGPALWRFTHGETEYRIAPIPFGGFVHIVGLDPEEEGVKDDPRAFDNRPLWARALAIFGGPFANYLTAMLLIVLVMTAWGGRWAVGVVSVRDEGPAAKAGIVAGDRIVSIDGEAVRNVGDLARLAGPAGNYSVALQRPRVDGPYERVTLRMSKPDGLFGVGVSQALVEGANPSFGEILSTSVRLPFESSIGIGASLLQAIKSPKAGGLGGPVAILKSAKDEAEGGVLRFLLFGVTLSVALGFFNLLPIPALDGGRLVFLGLEAISPRLLPSPALQMRIHSYGFAGLLGLIALLTVFDVRRLL